MLLSLPSCLVTRTGFDCPRVLALVFSVCQIHFVLVAVLTILVWIPVLILRQMTRMTFVLERCVLASVVVVAWYGGRHFLSSVLLSF